MKTKSNMTVLKLQSEAVIKFDNFRNFDGSEYGLVLHEKIKELLLDQIQKAYIAGINNPKEIRAETNHLKTLMFGIKLGRIIGVGLSIDKLSIQSKGK